MGWKEWVLVVGLIIGCGTIFNILSFFGQRMLNKPEKISWDSTTSTLLIDRCHFKYCFRAKRLSVDRVYNLKDFKIQNIFLLNFA
jgi:hypothetical protein